MAQPNRLRKAIRSVRRNPRGVAQRLARQFSELTRLDELEIPVRMEDLADSLALERPRFAPVRAEASRIAWVTVPPRAGSGGHTTMFRMMRAAHEGGFANSLLFYNRHDADLAEYAGIVRRGWPWLQCEIGVVGQTIRGFDAVVASSWATAHVVAKRADPAARRVYFIQDFEPYFYPRGSQYAFAEDSYRFGFRNIALGHMVQDCLASELGVASDFVPFGCDTETYRLLELGDARRGIVVYVKRGNDRRGYGLAVEALEIFHRLHPDEPIHLYGDRVPALSVPVLQHGGMTPAQLNELYNTVVAGLALSFTNISLVAEELLAAGAIPVVNDSPLARADLDNRYARWARATPMGLAGALSEAVSNPDRDALARRAAASVAGRSWQATGEAVVAALRSELEMSEAHVTY